MINKTTKRLLSASRLNINFDYVNSHRWVSFYAGEVTENESLYSKLRKNNIFPDTRIYGNIIDCLNYIDFLLKKIGELTLEQQFDEFNDWGFGDEFVNGNINWEDSGSETDDYFETCI